MKVSGLGNPYLTQHMATHTRGVDRSNPVDQAAKTNRADARARIGIEYVDASTFEKIAAADRVPKEAGKIPKELGKVWIHLPLNRKGQPGAVLEISKDGLNSLRGGHRGSIGATLALTPEAAAANRASALGRLDASAALTPSFFAVMAATKKFAKTEAAA